MKLPNNLSKNDKLFLVAGKIGHLRKILYLCNQNIRVMLEIETRIVEMLKTVFDPEIPVNVYDLGLIYRVEENNGNVEIDMTLTAPNCPAADFIADDVREKVASVKGVKEVKVNIVYEPEWSRDMMSEEAKLELGLL